MLLVFNSGFYNVLSIVFLSTDSMEIPEQFINVGDGVLGKNKSFLHIWVKINVCRTTNLSVFRLIYRLDIALFPLQISSKLFLDSV